MKMKFLLASAFLMLFAFAACGRNQTEDIVPPPYEAEDYTPAPEPDYDVTEPPEELDGAMGDLFGAYQDLVNVLDFMIGELREVETEEDLAEWRTAFDSVYMYVGLTLDLLTEVTEHMPVNQQDDFITLGAAVFLLQDGMGLLLDELDAGAFADSEAMLRIIDEFEMVLVVANMITGNE